MSVRETCFCTTEYLGTDTALKQTACNCDCICMSLHLIPLPPPPPPPGPLDTPMQKTSTGLTAASCRLFRAKLNVNNAQKAMSVTQPASYNASSQCQSYCVSIKQDSIIAMTSTDEVCAGLCLISCVCGAALDLEMFCFRPFGSDVSSGAHMAPGRPQSSSSISRPEGHGGSGHMAPTCCQEHAAGVVSPCRGKLSEKPMTTLV